MRKIYAMILSFLIALFAISGVIINLVEQIRLSQPEDVIFEIINTLSYYTNLTNILVGLFFVANIFFLLFSKKINQRILSALLVNILIVGIAFNILKGEEFKPEGIRLYASIFNHYITPLLTLLYYLLYNIYVYSKKDVWLWVLYPLMYFLYILIRGSYTSFYPY